MKKHILFGSAAVAVVLLASCMDKYSEVDTDVNPRGESIYVRLQSPDQSKLSGTFNTYLRLVDDLGYDAVLSRTGSKTVFPANDEAFERFFSSNTWGVSTYEDLSESQKKVLLYTSMLDNAILIGMLSNISTVTDGHADVARGQALKHETSLSVTDTVTNMAPDALPANNRYWEPYAQSGLNIVRDGTPAMMVHFTNEQMTANGITTVGEGSDFEILTGEPYAEGATYIYSDKVLHGDVACRNGYIHQMQDVLVSPGNMAQVVGSNSETSLFSRLLDYYCAPYPDADITRQYNDYAANKGLPLKDVICQWRYFSAVSQGRKALLADPDGLSVGNTLNYDPGWNGYYPSRTTSSAANYSLSDIGAMLVPDNDAVRTYFLPGGHGAYLIDIYGTHDNTAENLEANLDDLFNKRPAIITSFINNLMLSSFIESVPSKFSTLINDASEDLGMAVDKLRRNNGRYDVRIANNGVVYVLGEMIAPDKYESVMAPAATYPDMSVMGWALPDNDDLMEIAFKYYLTAMTANYAFFIPDDEAFDAWYIDPATLGHGNGTQAQALHFYYDTSDSTSTSIANKFMHCDRYYYNTVSRQIGSKIGGVADIRDLKTQWADLLNYHTVVLSAGETLGANHYYKTKHGGTIYIPGSAGKGDCVMAGGQLDNGLPKSRIEEIYTERNGRAYRIDHIIQAPQNSVYKTLESNSQFSEFLEICRGFDADALMSWAGISDEIDEFGNSEQQQYTVFTSNYALGGTRIANACLDYNVKFFNTYNYTLYAPDNEAVEKAYALGLPRWSEILADYEQYGESATAAVKAAAKKKIKALRNFVRYHFQVGATYADNIVADGNALSLCTDDLGVAIELKIQPSSGNGQIVVTDMAGNNVTVSASSGLLVNKMARDYWLNADRSQASKITTSSFCAVHEVSQPLCPNKNGRYN